MDTQSKPSREADTCRGIKGGKPADGFIQGRWGKLCRLTAEQGKNSWGFLYHISL